jgi:glutamate 5-kinase
MSRKAPSLTDFRRIVVKVGSSLLVDSDGGRLHDDWLSALAEDIAACTGQARRAGGLVRGDRARRAGAQAAAGPLKLEDSQAAAAVGQIALARTWAEVLGRHGITAGQVLVTLQDTEERRRYLNARSTIDKLLEWRAVPVINENDTVATNEIRYGDNDRLAARVATMASADLLVLLSTSTGSTTAHLPTTPKRSSCRWSSASRRRSKRWRARPAPSSRAGRMRTKIEAGKIVTHGGTHMVIASGRGRHPLQAIADGARCTWFLTRQSGHRAQEDGSRARSSRRAR